ncbi:MAG: SMP-30/gluconolactonase/LRE family protein [Cellvibrionaceae bacterium]
MFSVMKKPIRHPFIALFLTASFITACSDKGNTEQQTKEKDTTHKAIEYVTTEIVKGSEFCGVHGLGVDANDNLYAGSVVGERVYKINIATGKAETIVAPPKGNADDIEFLPDGTMVWTSISQNAVRAKKPNGEVFDLAKDIVSVNSIAHNEKDKRLFVAQVFGGDGLWELDPDGEKPPRNIMKDMGGLNGFDIGPDGMIYGPLWFKKKIVKINPDTGEMQTVVDGFHTPAAANFDSNWNLYVLDTATGEVFTVDIKTGDKKLFVTLKTSLDNLAIDSNDQIYVSNMADNSIQKINPINKEITTIIPGGLSCSLAINVFSEKELTKDTIYLSDVFALRIIDGKSGEIKDILRAHKADTPIEYPTYSTSNENYLFVLGDGGLHQFRRKSLDKDKFELVKQWYGIVGIQAMTALNDNRLLMLHDGGTSLTLSNPLPTSPLDVVSSSDKHDSQSYLENNPLNIGQLITDKLQGATAISKVHHNKIYVVQRETQSIIEVDLISGEFREVINNLDQPQGLDITPQGNIVVMTGSPGSVLLIDPITGEPKEIASGINVGRLGKGANLKTSGISVSESGNIYVIADGDNSILRISPKP